MELPRVRIRVRCSKGTYIRTLCHDIGGKLGCGGCMEKLLRTRVERFSLSGAKKLEEVQKAVDQGTIAEFVVPVDQMFDAYPAGKVKPEGDRLVHNGNPFLVEFLEEISEIKKGEPWRIYDSTGEFIGIFARKGEKFAPIKMFYSKDV